MYVKVEFVEVPWAGLAMWFFHAHDFVVVVIFVWCAGEQFSQGHIQNC